MSDQNRPSDGSGASITRRTFVAGAAVTATTGGTIIIGTRSVAAAKKSPQAQVNYQDTPKGKRKCSICKHFEADAGTCKVVEGTVSPEGWCARFVKT